jgi:hypothetical protein
MKRKMALRIEEIERKKAEKTRQRELKKAQRRGKSERQEVTNMSKGKGRAQDEEFDQAEDLDSDEDMDMDEPSQSIERDEIVVEKGESCRFCSTCIPCHYPFPFKTPRSPFLAPFEEPGQRDFSRRTPDDPFYRYEEDKFALECQESDEEDNAP